MKRVMTMAALLTLAGCGSSETPAQNRDGRPGVVADKEAAGRDAAARTNGAALNSPRANTLQPGDLVNSTTDVGGGANVDNAPVKSE